MTRLTALFHTIGKEFKRERCGCNHNPPDDFFKSQWQNRTKSIAYLVYRWIVALFFTAVVIESMIEPNSTTSFWLYFIYLTNWGILMCMVTNSLGAVLVTIWHYHPEYADKLLNMHSITSPFRVYWILHIITLVSSIVISIIYWSILYDATEDGLSATNITTHALNSIIMFTDLLIVAHPLRLLHMIFPVLFGVVYVIFSVVYYLAGGLNKKGKPYVYNVLDWSKPNMATVTVFGVLLLSCCVYMLLFVIFKLRIAIHRGLNNASFFLPTTTSKIDDYSGNVNEKITKAVGDERGIQHSPSGISMVLGNYEGYQNKAFSSSKENVSK